MTVEIEITVNGETRAAASDASIADLLGGLQVPGAKVAVERNRAIVPKSAYATTRLQPGDHIEIVQFVGGG